MPLVSICIPAHNVVDYLHQTILSVLHQTFPDWELIIANGASNFEAGQRIQEIVHSLNDPRIRGFRNPDNFSMVENWNSSISSAKGSFLKLLCHDDLLLPDCLARQVQALQQTPQAVIAAGSRIIINRHGRRLFTRNGIGRTGYYRGRDIIRRCALSGTNIIGDPVNVMWRRGAMERVGMFDPAILYCTDVEFWLRLLSEGDMYFDSVPVGLYRIHPKASATSLDKVTVGDFMRVVQKQIDHGLLALSPRQKILVRLRSKFKNRLRQSLYNLLG